MLQSSPGYLKCFQCKKSPLQFSFLLCNHIICGKCISKIIQLGDKYNFVQCRCGGVTYFNQSNQMMQQVSVMRSDKNNDKDKKTRRINNEQELVGGKNIERIEQQQQLKKMIDNKNTVNSNNSKKKYIFNSNNRLISPKTKMNNNNLNNSHHICQQFLGYKHHQTPITTTQLSLSKIFSLQQSQLIVKDYDRGDCDSKRGNNQLMSQSQQQQSQLLQHRSNKNLKNNRKNTRYINQFTTHQINDHMNDSNIHCRQYHPYSSKDKEFIKSYNTKRDKNIEIFMLPNVKNITSSITLPQTIKMPESSSNKTSLQNSNHHHKSYKQQTNSKSSVHCRFNTEIDFMRMIFNKDLQQVKQQFDTILNHIKSVYQAIESRIKSLYVDDVIIKNTNNNKNTVSSNILRSQQQFNKGICQEIKSAYEQSISIRLKQLKKALFSYQHQSFWCNSKLTNSHQLSQKQKNHIIVSNSKNKTNDCFRITQTMMNNSQIADQQLKQDYNGYGCDCDYEGARLNNNIRTAQRFDTVNEKIKTIKNYQQQHYSKNNSQSNNNLRLNNKSPKAYNNINSKRVQTQNTLHSNLIKFCQKQNQNHTNLNKTTQKQNRKATNPLILERQTQHKRYFSPPIKYCQKHLQKKLKEAKNYISFIETLCYDTKIKSRQQLLKKAKYNDQLRWFQNRE